MRKKEIQKKERESVYVVIYRFQVSSHDEQFHIGEGTEQKKKL